MVAAAIAEPDSAFGPDAEAWLSCHVSRLSSRAPKVLGVQIKTKTVSLRCPGHLAEL